MRPSPNYGRAFKSDDGAGLVSTFAGAAVFLAFLLLATHVLVGLYATSIITSHALHAAGSAARNIDNVNARASADARLHSKLSGFRNVETRWLDNGQQLGVRVQAQRPNFLPTSLTRASSLNQIDRTVWVRVEQMQ